MRSIIVRTVVLGVLVSALTVSSASATKGTLHLTAPGAAHPLTTGDFYELEGGAVEYESTAGNLKCPSAFYSGLVAVDQTNNEKTDRLEVQNARGLYYGEGACAGSFPTGAENVQFWAGGSPLGGISLGTNLKAEFKTSAASEAQIQIYSEVSGHYCSYGVKKLKGTVTLAAPLSVTFSRQKLKLTQHSIANCPKTVSVTVSFSSYYDPNPKENEGRAVDAIGGSIS